MGMVCGKEHWLSDGKIKFLGHFVYGTFFKAAQEDYF